VDRAEAVQWVAENVMGMERKPCDGDVVWHTAGTFKDGYVNEGGFYCRWCGEARQDGWSEPCPEYPFPAFDLVQLMRKLAERGCYVDVENRVGKSAAPFLLCMSWDVIAPCRVTDDPFGDLCKWLARKYNEIL